MPRWTLALISLLLPDAEVLATLILVSLSDPLTVEG